MQSNQTSIRMIRVRPKVPGIYLLQRKVDATPKCVIINQDADVLYVYIDEKKFLLKSIDASAKWSPALVVIPKQL